MPPGAGVNFGAEWRRHFRLYAWSIGGVLWFTSMTPRLRIFPVAYLLTLVGLGFVAGCRCNKPPPTPQPALLKRPAIDLTHGGGGFPLDTDTLPADSKALLAALNAAYQARLVQPANVKIAVDVVPGHAGPLAPLDLLDIDLTGSSVREDYVPKDGLKKDTAPLGTLQVRELRYQADPLKYQNYTAGMRMTARDAELAVTPTNDGKLSLSLTDCRTGRARLEISIDSLRQSLQEGVKIKRSLAFMIDSVDLNMSSDGPHSIAVDVLVRSRVLLVPATFHMTARADIDSDFNVHFSELSAAGADPTGKIVAQIVQSRLDKVNNRTAQLLKLPGDKIRVSDFEIKLDKTLTVDVAFVGTK